MMKHLESIENAFPVVLQVKNKRCVVVGGGPDAISKASILLRAKAEVRLVHEGLDTEVLKMLHSEQLEISNKPYSPAQLKEAFLVCAVTEDPVLNKRIIDDCNERNILCSAIDHHWQQSDFITPASLSYQGLIVSVTGRQNDFAHVQHVRRMLQDFLYSTEPAEHSPPAVKGQAALVVTHHTDYEDANNSFLDHVDFMRFQLINAPIEPAFLGGGEPSIDEAVGSLVQQDVKHISILPFFLFKGRRWFEELPKLVKKALNEHGADDVEYALLDPIGNHPLVAELMLSIVGSELKGD